MIKKDPPPPHTHTHKKWWKILLDPGPNTHNQIYTRRSKTWETFILIRWDKKNANTGNFKGIIIIVHIIIKWWIIMIL